MSLTIINCTDGHELGAFSLPTTAAESKGGLVILHEIFGVTSYIKDVCRYWSERGFDALAPSLFDRQERGAVIDYTDPTKGLDLVSKLSTVDIQTDIAACEKDLRRSNSSVGILGYCWGGGLAFGAACDLDFDAAASIYGTRLTEHVGKQPRCPVQFQFAETDKHASPEIRHMMAETAPEAEHIVLSGDHGFDRKASSHEELVIRHSSRSHLATFFETHLTKSET